MSLFKKATTGKRVGVIIDVGSGSAAVSLIVSEPNIDEPVILWSRREDAILKNIKSLQDNAKLVVTALMNVLLEFETSGRQALLQYGASKIDTVQCTVAAPWAHTIAKRIEYNQDNSFEVSKELIEELVATAISKSKSDLNDETIVNDLGLAIASRATLHVLLNGYKTKNPQGQYAQKVTLLHTTVAVQEYILQAIEELHSKMFASTALEVYSYALALHCVAEDLAPHQTNLSLLDITHECSELSVIRDNTLTHVTHANFGIYSLAREFAAVLDVPLSEALGYLKTDMSTIKSQTTEAKYNELEEVLLAYTNKLAELFKQTGDELVIPRHCILHCDALYEGFLATVVSKATKLTIAREPVLTNASSIILQSLSKSDKATYADTAILVANHFFHKGNQCITIEHT